MAGTHRRLEVDGEKLVHFYPTSLRFSAESLATAACLQTLAAHRVALPPQSPASDDTISPPPPLL